MNPLSIPDHPILLVDDEPSVVSSEEKLLNSSGLDNIITCCDPREVMPLLAKSEVEVVLLDIGMPHISGDVLLSDIRELYPHIPVIIVTASDDIETAVRCMKAGAFDYMVKAVEPSRLTSGVRRAIEARVISRRYAVLRDRLMADEIRHPGAFAHIVTRNRKMQAIFVFIESIAPTRETVLITGETGAGKELAAEAVHRVSERKGEIVTVNVASLDDTMFADTLFGHVRGAYTGADDQRKGLIQQAKDGTLFLDEIGDLTQASQIKLLRLLERNEYYPLGSDLVRSTNARFLLATNQNLVEMVEQSRFRKDLYFRLQTHQIRIPPLRDRKDDLPLLLDFFLEEASRTLQKKRLAIPKELLTLLETYDFPGNVRELRSMVFAAVSRQREKMLSIQPFKEAVGRDDLRISTQAGDTRLTFPDRLPTIKKMTEMLIAESLERSKGNQAIAAGLLGITPQALNKRLRKGKTEPAD